MTKTKVERRSHLSVQIYRKTDDRLSIVFLKRRKRYRLTTVLNAAKLISEIDLLRGLKGVQLIQIGSPRGRKWVLEVMVENNSALLRVWEMIPGRTEQLAFNWRGSPEELVAALPRRRGL